VYCIRKKVKKEKKCILGLFYLIVDETGNPRYMPSFYLHAKEFSEERIHQFANFIYMRICYMRTKFLSSYILHNTRVTFIVNNNENHLSVRYYKVLKSMGT
jgi:hypothetical protein